MNLERAQKIAGWMSNDELIYLAQTASKCSLIAEIGSWMGRSTCALAENTTGTVYAIDTWAGSPETAEENVTSEQLFEQFTKNTEALPIKAIKKTSVDAAQYLYSQGIKFDMIFIDAAHDYESVKQDILAWKPLLKDNGIMCGHDYGAWPGVTRAVDETIPITKVAAGFIWTTDVGSMNKMTKLLCKCKARILTWYRAKKFGNDPLKVSKRITK